MAAHRRLHSVRHRAARSGRDRAQRVCTAAATCAHTARRWAAGVAQNRARQSRTMAGHRAHRPPASARRCAQLQCAPWRTLRAATFSESGPRLESRLLRQSALEDLKNLSRTKSSRQGDRNKSNHEGGGTRRRRVEEAAAEEEKWRREAATS
ncbi:hypothetical protein F511_45381 [Dorcoceras hygrometricum]|uniref:Uncharacterized protein n=1 Tax=Dorcoceras hygrometricum TaxID=472368 RepID=A0A2Z6ZW63_9LAMI|nr:hypothetical protein F511_45381 [Dorcoceras hygrometricum]